MELQKKLRAQRPARRPGLSLVRGMTRIALLGAIVLLALLRGYTPDAWMWVGIAVLWAAALPFVLARVRRGLRESALSPTTQKVVLASVAIVLLLGFAYTVRRILP